MISLKIFLEGDGATPHLDPQKCIRTEALTITGLEGGTVGGNPSIAFIVELDGGRWVFAETTLKLFLTAADAFKAKYGDPRRDAEGVA